MVLCSLKRQQWNQWTRLYCLYLHLPKSTSLESLCNPEGQIKMARDGLEESVLWQNLVVYPVPSPTGGILGSLSSHWFQTFPWLPFPQCTVQSACPSLMKGWDIEGISSCPIAMECKSRQRVPSNLSRSGSGLAWTATKTQSARHIIEQPMQLAALHLFWGFFSDFETPRSRKCALK